MFHYSIHITFRKRKPVETTKWLIIKEMHRGTVNVEELFFSVLECLILHCVRLSKPKEL